MNDAWHGIRGGVAGLVVCLLASAAFGQLPPPTILDEPAAPLDPLQHRSQADEDRLVAGAHFAEAQLLLRRGRRHAALSKLERAWRYDPTAQSIANQIVPLASRLGRGAEATRYAVLAAEQNPANSGLLTQLGAILVNQRDWKRALWMFEQAERLVEDELLARLPLNIEIGRLLILLDQPRQAAQRFEFVKAVLADPENFGVGSAEVFEQIERPELLFSVMGESFLLADRWDEALEVYELQHQREPNDAQLALQKARLSAARNQWPQANEYLESYFAIGAANDAVSPYQLLEKLIAHDTADPQAARLQLIERLQSLAVERPGEVPLIYFLAERLSDAGRLDQAIERYRQLIAEQPTATAYRRLVELHVQQGDAAALLDLLAELLEGGGAFSQLGGAIDRLAADRELVRRIAELGVQRDQRPAQWAATLVAIAAGQFEAADSLYQQQLSASGEPPHAIAESVGLAWFAADQAGRAAAIFRGAISAQPPSAELPLTYFYLASALAVDGQHEEALRAAERAAALDDAPHFRSRPAWIRYHAKQYDQARQLYLELLEDYRDDYRSEEVRTIVRDARLVLSNINVNLKRMPEAEEQLQRVLDEFPEDAGALNDLGYLWADQDKHLERALSMVQQAVEQAPQNAAYRDSLGWALLRLGRFEEAVRELETAAKGPEPDGVILDHLGDAYEAAGRRSDAVATWRAARDAFQAAGDTENAAAARTKLAEHPE